MRLIVAGGGRQASFKEKHNAGNRDVTMQHLNMVKTISKKSDYVRFFLLILLSKVFKIGHTEYSRQF
jgi:hypothetical protein